jgi:transcription elongation GreA/GreB family factor
MLNKQDVYLTVKAELGNKIKGIQQQFDELKLALQSETKSTAGDKHETGRAMAQLEQEKLSKQLLQFKKMQEGLSLINPEDQHKTIQFGSLVQTETDYFFISIPIGQITFGNDQVFCLSAMSPLGQNLVGKSTGDSVRLNQEVRITGLS